MKIKNIKYIYVLDDSGKPLMPTKRLGMVRRWLKSGQAHWYKNSRNTIQFDRPTEHHLQKITQGCDLGDHLGISVITNNREIYSSESYCDGKQVHKRMQECKMYRRTRRNRLRYRAPRFNNRKHAKYAPSIKRKLAFQIKEIAQISEFLPVNNYIFEGSIFDINKLTHHRQQQKGYHNILDFLYARDNGCDALDGKQYPKNDLVVHHLVHRANGGTNNPDNLVLLTRWHHNQANHNNGILDELTKKRQQTFKNVDTRGAYFMNIPNVELPKYFDYLPTFGYITAQRRKQYSIAKTHHDDAFVIAGGTNHTLRLGYTIYREKLRCNNRCLVKSQTGTPIGAFVRRDIHVKEIDGTDFSNSIITIDDHKLFVYDCSYTIYPTSALKAAGQNTKAPRMQKQDSVKISSNTGEVPPTDSSKPIKHKNK